MNGSSGLPCSHLTDQQSWACSLGSLGLQNPQPAPLLSCLLRSELEGVKFCAWLLPCCGPWLGQNICLLLWLPYT